MARAAAGAGDEIGACNERQSVGDEAGDDSTDSNSEAVIGSNQKHSYNSSIILKDLYRSVY